MRTASLFLAFLFALPTVHAQPFRLFQGLGDLPEGAFGSIGFGVSADGRVAVGSSTGVPREAFRWTESGGIVGLGTLNQNHRSTAPGGQTGAAYDASADGMVVVGKSPSTSGERAFRWTASGMVDLGVLGDDGVSDARGVSSDGTVVVGTSRAGTRREAFRWTEVGDMVGLGFLSESVPSPTSWAFATNQDGSVAVGWSTNEDDRSEAFRWTAAGDMEGLGMCSVCTSSVARGVSADGSVIVGWTTAASGTEATRWTAVDEWDLLGDLPGGPISSLAFDVSADGSVVVGEGFTENGVEAFIWTEEDEMRSLKDVLEEDIGLNLTGWTLRTAHAVSDDGTVVVGDGINPQGDFEGWRAVLANVWAEPVDGLFSDPSNWVPGAVPLPTSLVAFNDSGADPFTVTFDEATISRSLIVSDSEVTFDLADHSYTLTGLPLRIGPGEGPPAALSVENGTLTTEAGFVVGDGPGSEGTLTARAATFQVAEGVSSAVGDAGVGQFTGVETSTLLLTGSIFVGHQSSGNGTLTISDGSEAATQDTLWVGYRGVGGLEVTAGSALTAANVVLGRHPGSFGTALVIGAGSRLEVANAMRVGVEGAALFQAQDGATICVDDTDYVVGPQGAVSLGGDVIVTTEACPDAATRSEMVARGAGGALLQTPVLRLAAGAEFEADAVTLGTGGTLGGDGTLDLPIMNDGTLDPGGSGVAGRFTVENDYAQTAAGALRIDLGGLAPGSEHDQLAVAGTAALGGTLRVGYLGDYLPTVGETYALITAGTVEGMFAAVETAPGLTVEITYTTTEVTATVTGVVVSNESDSSAPGAFALHAPYPNPTGGALAVAFDLPEPAAVRIVLYDVLGRRVIGLLDDERSVGRHEVEFDASALTSGVYVARLTAGDFVQARRLTVLR